jgi:UDP-N-acetylglucosamine 2-epimerase
VGHSTNTIVQAAHELLTQEQGYANMSNARQLFGDGRSAEKIVKIVENFLTARDNSGCKRNCD